jgi:hypothetical protein
VAGVRVLTSQKTDSQLDAGDIRYMRRKGKHPTGIATIRNILTAGFRHVEVYLLSEKLPVACALASPASVARLARTTARERVN